MIVKRNVLICPSTLTLNWSYRDRSIKPVAVLSPSIWFFLFVAANNFFQIGKLPFAAVSGIAEGLVICSALCGVVSHQKGRGQWREELVLSYMAQFR